MIAWQTSLLMFMWLFIGAGLGFVFILSQWWTVQKLGHEARPLLTPLTFMVGLAGRWVLAIWIIVLALQHGPHNLISLLIGFWLFRWATLFSIHTFT